MMRPEERRADPGGVDADPDHLESIDGAAFESLGASITNGGEKDRSKRVPMDRGGPVDARPSTVAGVAAVEFTINGDPARARQTAVDALSSRQFSLSWTDEWTAVAEKGSTTKNLLLGAFAQYFKVGVAVRSLDDTHSVIRVESLTSGWMGGLWGANKTKSNLRELREELGSAFHHAGVLVDTRDV